MFIKKNLKYQKSPLPDKVSMSDFEMMSSIESFREYMLKRHTVRDFSKRSVDFAIIQKAIQIAGSAQAELITSHGTLLLYRTRTLRKQ